MTADRPAGALLATCLHRDAELLVIDKPAGLAVSTATSNAPSLEDQLERLRFGARELPQPAHRLDQDTSGCLVLGRSRKALRRLGRAFEAGEVRKTYWAIVEGAPPGKGVIDLPLAKRSTKARGWWMEVADDGKPSFTAWRRLAARDGHAWLELVPTTGRTHQLRVHLAAIGCPILGDPKYGTGRAAPPMLLHARAIDLPARDGGAIHVEAPAPPAMQAWIERLAP